MASYRIQIATKVSLEAAIRAGCDVLPPGFPFVMDIQRLHVEHEPTVFMKRLCLAGIASKHLIVSPKTALCRAHDLKDFLEYLAAIRCSDDQITADTLFSYASTMANQISPFTHEIYSQNTISRRVWTAVEYSLWLADRLGFQGSRMFELKRLQRSSGGAWMGRNHRRSAGGAVRSTLVPTAYKLHEPHILSAKEAKCLLAALRNRASGDISSRKLNEAIGKRNYLMAKLALLTGMRREEVCCLTLGTIQAVHADPQNRVLHPILLTRTKNSAQRKVLVPSRLLLELQDYCVNERLAKCGIRCNGRCGMSGPLFPSSRCLRSTRCKAMSPQNLSLVIRDAARRAGLTREKLYLQTKNQPGHFASVPDVSTHDLRHTYAVWTYLILRSQGDTNPWLFIQAQLGHRSSETTISTYLQMARVFENSISETLVNYVTSLAEALSD